MYIDNAVHAHILAEKELRRCPEVVNGFVFTISDGGKMTGRELCNTLISYLPENKSIPPVTEMSLPLFYAIAYISEAINWLTYSRYIGSIHALQLSLAAVRHCLPTVWFDISAAKRKLWYTPLFSTTEALKAIAASVQNP